MKYRYVYGKSMINNEDGKVVLRIIIVILSLVLVGFSIFVLLNHIGNRQEVYHRKALAISEFGLLKALEGVKGKKNQFEDISRTPFDGGWYTVRFKLIENDDSTFLYITSKGHIGSASEVRKCILFQINNKSMSDWKQYKVF